MVCAKYKERLTSARRNHSTVTKASSLYGIGSSDDRQEASVKIDLDLDARLSDDNIRCLRENLLARGILFDLEQLVKDYKVFKNLSQQKDILLDERTNVARAMADIVRGKSPNDINAKELLISQGAEIKEKLKSTMAAWWKAEENVLSRALQLPNRLHAETPLSEEKVLERCQGTIEMKGEPASHLQYAEKLGLLKFSGVGPRATYLMGELAEMEGLLVQHVTSQLLSAGLQQIACPEIFRTLVVEGCGLDYDSPNEVFTLYQKEDHLKANAFHLKGNSLLSYAAFLTKQQIKTLYLPLKMFAVGRHYKPPVCEDFPGLYGTIQSNRITVFTACKDASEATDTQNLLTHFIWTMIKNLGLPARLILVEPSSLTVSESLRAEIQVWAPSLKTFVQVAAVSNHGDYVSRRLMTFHSGESHTKDKSYVHMVSGVALDVTMFLASLLEHSYQELLSFERSTMRL
ncbi:hypothetical protein C0Q70_17443 [Pomacea canaliculata]|uniref:serine--tRNA ligase n=1 Tax=Pomacea canaliculata TaxID=400727 RepID=A0A2T7NKF1_POMCA|nr:hypothetical protein C0Q70_17443 [Pomacea canaliculata]